MIRYKIKNRSSNLGMFLTLAIRLSYSWFCSTKVMEFVLHHKFRTILVNKSCLSLYESSSSTTWFSNPVYRLPPKPCRWRITNFAMELRFPLLFNRVENDVFSFGPGRGLLMKVIFVFLKSKCQFKGQFIDVKISVYCPIGN